MNHPEVTLGTPLADILRVQPLDLFPQTFHVETAAELHLT